MSVRYIDEVGPSETSICICTIVERYRRYSDGVRETGAMALSIVLAIWNYNNSSFTNKDLRDSF